MENAKKMILVEPHVIERIRQNENIPEKPLSLLDKEMQKILNSTIEDREKWSKYSQILQRYLHFANAERQPIVLPIITDTTDDMIFNNMNEKEINNDKMLVPKSPAIKEDVTQEKSIPSKYTPNYMFNSIPKTYRKRGELLLSNLLENKKNIKWDSNGRVIINNKTIPFSNILDLINDVLRPSKRAKPLGWKKFASTLKEINIPLSCIGNPETLQYIKRPDSSESEKDHPAPEHQSETPKTSGSSSLLTRKLDWETWNPN